MMRGQALIIVLLFLVLCTFIAIAFLTNVTSSGVGENAAASENRASQLATTAVQLVEGTITNATVSGTYPTIAWASQPGMIRTYGKGGANGASSAPLAYYKLYSSGTMVVTTAMDMNPNDIFSADVPATWDKMPSYYTDLNAPLFVTNPATSGTTEVFPIADPRAFDADIAVTGFGYRTSMPGSTSGLTIDGIVTSGTTYANDTTSRLPMPVAWIYVLKDGTLTVPPAPPGGVSGGASWSNSTNPPTPTNPIVGRVAFWTDDESGKINVNTASEGTYWDTPIANTGLVSTGTFGYPQTAALGDAGFAQIQPAQHEYQRYPGHPATTCLSAVFGNALANSGLTRADIVKAITDAVPRISDYGKGATTDYAPPSGSLTTTMGGTTQVSGSGSVITDEDRLYVNLDEFQFEPYPRTTQNLHTLMSGTAAQQEQNDVDTCRFFLTAHSKAPELNMFGLPRVAIWPVWSDATNYNYSSKRTTFDSEIARCSTINASGTNNDPHEMLISRYDPTSSTNDWLNIPRNQQLFGYLQSMTSTPVPGFGQSFAAKYGKADRDQILAEIFDYVRCTNLADVTGSNPYTQSSQQGQVVPLQLSTVPGVVTVTATNGNNPRGAGRIATPVEFDLMLVKIDDRINIPLTGTNSGNSSSNTTETGTNICTQVNIVNANETGATTTIYPTNTGKSPNTAVEWTIVPRFICPMAGYTGLANNFSLQMSQAGTNPLQINSTSVVFPAQMPTLTGTGLIPNDRDSGVGGNIGCICMLQGADARGATNPPTNMWPTGLVLVNGTSGQTMTIGGSVGYSITAPSSTGSVIQSGTFAFPTTTVPIPGLALYQSGTTTSGTPIYSWDGTDRAKSSAYVVSGGTGTFTYPAAVVSGAASRGGPRLGSGSNWNNNPGALSYGINPTPSCTFDSAGTDVMRAVVATGTIGSTGISGDERMIALSSNLGSTAFSLDTKTGGVAATGNDYIVTSMRDGDGSVGINPSNIYFTSPAYGVPFTVYRFGGNTPGEQAPDIPAMSGTVQISAGIPGDFDNGEGPIFDGPWMNKPDEGMTTGNSTTVPYIGDYQIDTETTAPSSTLFSPNRQVSSPVMFGSLPVGLDHPWRTLLFRPATLPGYQTAAGSSYTHPGNVNPASYLPDHLLLDLFWMPVVEPYGISEPFTTAGKINLNTQIAPFTYITRTTGLQAVLKSVMITALSPGGTAATSGTSALPSIYKAGYNSNGTAPTFTTRYPIDTNQTVGQLTVTSTDTNVYPEFARGSHSLAAPNFFVSASQICDVPLIPSGWTPPLSSGTTLSSFWSNSSMTGDNSLERPYSMIYPRVTTKSNIFTVHVIAQSLKQTPADLANGASGTGTWTENVDQVTGEVRGSYTIEKYYDPNADDLSYYASAKSGAVAFPSSLDSTISSYTTAALRGARWRLLNVKRFGQ